MSSIYENKQLVYMLNKFILNCHDIYTNGATYSFILNGCSLDWGKTTRGDITLTWNETPLDLLLSNKELKSIASLCYNRLAEIREKGVRSKVMKSLEECVRGL